MSKGDKMNDEIEALEEGSLHFAKCRVADDLADKILDGGEWFAIQDALITELYAMVVTRINGYEAGTAEVSYKRGE